MPLQSKVQAFSVQIERELPANIADDDLHDFAGQQVYRTHDSVLRNFANVRVSSDSIVFNNLIVDSTALYSLEQRAYYQTRYLAKKLLLSRTITLDKSQNYLLATDQESSGHFHWLTEVLSRLWLIREKASEFVLLLPDNGYVRSIGLESLERLDLNFASVVWMRENELFKVPNLFHISKVARSGQMHDGIMPEIRQTFVGDPVLRSRKIYVSRANAARRKILNDREVEALVGDYGFEIFSSEGMTLREQIGVFAECSTVLGIHGAGLANCLFMPPGKVIELKKKEPNHGYWHMAGSLGHKYYYYNGIPDSEESLIGRGCNLTIPIKDFEQRILRAI
jgi:hypothetical protein